MPDDAQPISSHPFPESSAQLAALDPDLLASELAVELLGDPLDELDSFEPGDQAQRMQGLRIFCEHRDPRAFPLLLPLLDTGCPIVRMSTVYPLGLHPHPLAVEPLLTVAISLKQQAREGMKPIRKGLVSLHHTLWLPCLIAQIPIGRYRQQIRHLNWRDSCHGDGMAMAWRWHGDGTAMARLRSSRTAH